jgi:hypothetical protein
LCRTELAAVHEFVYQVESLDFLDDPVALEILRRLPTNHGEPLRLCGDCRGSIEANACDQEDDAADARARVWAWRLVLWLLVVPLGLLFAQAAAVEVVNRVR